MTQGKTKPLTIGGDRIAGYTGSDKLDYFGRFVWFCFGKLLIPVDTLKNLYAKHDLDMEYFPTEIQPKYVFQVATKDMEEKGTIKYKGEDVFYEYEVHQLKGLQRKKTDFRRRLVRRLHVLDAKGRKVKDHLDHRELGEWEFDPVTEQIIATPLSKDPEHVAVFKALTEKMEDRYKVLLENYTEKQLRDNVRKIFNRLEKVPIKASVYFVLEKEEYVDVILKLSQILDEVNDKYGLSIFETEVGEMPVIRSEPNRKRLVRKFETMVIKDMAEVMQEAADILEQPDRKITPGQFTGFNNRHKKLEALMDEYGKMLDSQMGKARAEYELFGKQLGALLGRMDSGDKNNKKEGDGDGDGNGR